MSSHLALLRAIAHVPMHPFREAMQELGHTEVTSYGMSSNLLFTSSEREPDSTALAQKISKRLSVVATVRTRDELREIVAKDPFHGREGASMMFLMSLPSMNALTELQSIKFDGERPQIVERTVYFIYPARPLGKKTGIDFERILKVQGTARSSRIVSQILKKMS